MNDTHSQITQQLGSNKGVVTKEVAETSSVKSVAYAASGKGDG